MRRYCGTHRYAREEGHRRPAGSPGSAPCSASTGTSSWRGCSCRKVLCGDRWRPVDPLLLYAGVPLIPAAVVPGGLRLRPGYPDCRPGVRLPSSGAAARPLSDCLRQIGVRIELREIAADTSRHSAGSSATGRQKRSPLPSGRSGHPFTRAKGRLTGAMHPEIFRIRLTSPQHGP